MFHLIHVLLLLPQGTSSTFGDRLHNVLSSRQQGEIPICRLNFTTDVWTGCEDVLAQFDLTLEQFMYANPGITKNCGNFIPGNTYCVAALVENRRNASTSGLCGAQVNFNVTCLGSSFGECCAGTGRCGSGNDYCAVGNCQEGACEGGGAYSTDGLCGRDHLYVPCPPKFGLCCSQWGFCGNGTDFCGSGCQSGTCDASLTTTAPPPTQTPTLPPGSVSRDGTCGFGGRLVCKGSGFGDCCSAAGYCGNSARHCSNLLGCQPLFGACSTTTT
ncbi:hypothetical protein F4803DRAFT_277012 [Xylaria telfairii]|nr:hypothetical protein F4803DRAFT_277012 [Xylaria telfairii]